MVRATANKGSVSMVRNEGEEMSPAHSELPDSPETDYPKWMTSPHLITMVPTARYGSTSGITAWSGLVFVVHSSTA